MLTQEVQVNKRVKDESAPRHAVFTWDFPESTAEAVEKYGEELTLKLINDAITLDVQGPARKVLEACPAGLSDEEYSQNVSDVMRNHQIRVKRTRGTGAPKINAYQQLARDLSDPEKREAIIAKFRSQGINLEMSTNDVAV